LDVGFDEDVYWNVSSYGADQEAYVSLTTIDPNGTEIGLMLKAQNTANVSPGVIDVVYDPGGQRVQVWTYINNSEGWKQRGANIPVTFADGDQFGARARADGQVEVYRNGVLVATRDVTGWPHYANGGYIGLFCIDASNAALDDFGGGTLANP
jgi:hypothetical protein